MLQTNPMEIVLFHHLLVKEKDFGKVSNFEIGEINEFSNHCYLNLKTEVQTDKVCNENINSKLDAIQICTFDENSEKLKGNYDCEFKYADKDRVNFNHVINSEDITKKSA